MNSRYKARMPVLILAALLVCAAPLWAQSISLPEYQHKLEEIRQQIESSGGKPGQLGKLQSGIPEKLTVHTQSGDRAVNLKDLRDDIAALSLTGSANAPKSTEQIEKYLDQLEHESTGYQNGPQNLYEEREGLRAILARKEFRHVHGPTAQSVWLGKLFNWIGRLLHRLFGGHGNTAMDVMTIVVYSAATVVLCVVAIWVFRRLRRGREEFAPREILPFAPSARSWRTWLAEARQFAEQQDWRNSIHLAYWAGISFLEEHGAWRPNRARTPREYLRLLNAGGQRHQYPPLSSLTRRFEVVWYGQRAASARDFEATLGELEKMGCR